MTDEKIIVLVSDKDDSKHGEISVLDDPQHAERLVETLLEAGFEQERIRVFTGNSSEFQVSHRPVVALTADGEEKERQPAAAIVNRRDDSREDEAREARAEEAPAREPAAEQPPVGQPQVEQTVAAEVAENKPQAQAAAEEGEGEEVAETAEAAPTKFSSLFRSA